MQLGVAAYLYAGLHQTTYAAVLLKLTHHRCVCDALRHVTTCVTTTVTSASLARVGMAWWAQFCMQLVFQAKFQHPIASRLLTVEHFNGLLLWLVFYTNAQFAAPLRLTDVLPGQAPDP
jgi:hypothetical protein